MVDWFVTRKLDVDYDIKIAWFVPPINDDTITKRANMPDDKLIRGQNTCTIHDIFDAGFGEGPDFIMRTRCGNKNSNLIRYIGALYEDWNLMKDKMQSHTH